MLGLSIQNFVPVDVIHMILIYYFIRERFSRTAQALIITDTYNNTKIKNIARGWQTALGSFIIDIAKYPSTTVFQWRFKLVSADAAITIGIMEHIKDKPLNIEEYVYFRVDRFCYAWSQGYYSTSFETHDGHSYSYAGFDDEAMDRNGNDNDIIMTLNVNAKTIEYTINDTQCGIAFRNIDLSRKYKLAICLGKGEVEIVDFCISELEIVD